MIKKLTAVLLLIATLFLCPACGDQTLSSDYETPNQYTGQVPTIDDYTTNTTSAETLAPPITAETVKTTVTTTTTTAKKNTTTTTAPPEPQISKNGSYTTKEDVALYIHTYGCLPQNFITKQEAKALGWEGRSLEPYAPGKCIGGDYFGNYEGLLPEANGRSYTECDIDTLGKSSRGAKRIVFSNDGLIYYTDDHYESFTLLYE